MFPNIDGLVHAAILCVLRLVVGAAFVVTGLGIAGTPASAQVFLEGQSNGMNKCVRAILQGYEVKRVNVHGHHFNCQPLTRWQEGRRIISLSRNIRGGYDDQYTVWFRVNRVGTREYVKANSVGMRVIRRPLGRVGDLGDLFKYTSPPGAFPKDYPSFVEEARRIRPREQGNWKAVARQITIIVIAQLGEPWP